MPAEIRGEVSGLYVHVPFCAAECGYCAFSREILRDGNDVSEYLTALSREVEFWLRSLGGRIRPDTLFIGGGTPTMLSSDDWRVMEEVLAPLLDRARLQELSVEGNPESTDGDRLDAMMRFGMTRLSLGAQSSDPDVLDLLDRCHGWNQVVTAVETAKESTSVAISLDLIYGVPSQDVESWAATLDAALALGPDHLSAYCLSYEEGSAITRRRAARTLTPLPESEQRACYERLVEVTRSAGLDRYEISNFARPGHACRHNLDVWRGGTFLGIGPSAHSSMGGYRLRNRKRREEWQRALDESAGPIDRLERIGTEEERGERLMRLRIAEGVPCDGLPPTGGAFWDRVEILRGEGLLTIEEEHLRLTDRACFVSDELISDLWSAWDRQVVV